MNRTQYFTATSIDGFIADQGNSLDWLFAAAEGRDDGRFERFFAGVGAMAMGSTTYEWVFEHEGLLEHPEKWGEWYGDTPSWIFTHRPLPVVEGARLTFVQGPVRPVHEEMVRAANGKNIWIVGGGDLVGQFHDEELLDDLLLNVAPAMLGAGAPLLPRRIDPAALTLVRVDRDERFVYLEYAVHHDA
ncbi:MAG TPA: dihydrofolate reductase family protein [Actinomycetota bacterium]|nr:dihydrofolate reductase family protein [Actinomycetota bacterium]